MQELAPGRIIGGRYTLDERLLTSADGRESWTATDTTLQAEVSVTLVPADSDGAAGMLDAARRAAHVRDHRLVRVLDVGSTDGVSWVVEEHHRDTRSLVDVIEDKPLTGEQARTLLGEASSCLAVAARRGMHHMRLTPYMVQVTTTGGVLISGLGTAIALDGGEEPTTEDAARADSVGLLALAYYAMTTRWPLPTSVAGVLPAPKVVGGVPAPSEIAAGVPADLDMLCRTALNGKPGPVGPAQLAREVAPWRPSLYNPDPVSQKSSARPTTPAVPGAKKHESAAAATPSTEEPDLPGSDPRPGDTMSVRDDDAKEPAKPHRPSSGLNMDQHPQGPDDEVTTALKKHKPSPAAKPTSDNDDDTTKALPVQSGRPGKQRKNTAAPSQDQSAPKEATGDDTPAAAPSSPAESSASAKSGARPTANKPSREDRLASAAQKTQPMPQQPGRKRPPISAPPPQGPPVVGPATPGVPATKDSKAPAAQPTAPPRGESAPPSLATAPPPQGRRQEPAAPPPSLAAKSPTPRPARPAPASAAPASPAPAGPAPMQISPGGRPRKTDAPVAASVPQSPDNATEKASDRSGPHRSPSEETTEAARHHPGEAVAKLGTFARAAADKAQLKKEQYATRKAAEQAERRELEHSVRLSDIPSAPSEYPSAGPLLHFVPEDPPGTHSRLVLSIVAATVVVALLIAMVVLLQAVSGGDDAPQPAKPSAAGPASSRVPADSSTPAAPGKPISIVKGVSVDPYGDGSENDGQLPRAFDGDPATRWASERYLSDPGWGGDGNRGVGAAFQLGSPTALKQVKLSFGETSQTGAIYVSDRPEITGATKVGSFSEATGTTTVEVTDAPRAAYVMVWFTKAAKDNGGFRVALNEIVPLG
ncbi:hypothetical protein KEM60_00344 [Austwickia sp. TVS 96-490-7B]|uniref:protein kinase family protein n=1 Tax=Austwickia sp. TVS 96-490-7B TaxID=2830843 RepID=UPI001C59F354|nr:protein kinase family protein [Austwickia sp. TVS 96-490-7B]MBW3084160.1 hypothetical protein [Austwickia sp. TVS 96-490-7B]